MRQKIQKICWCYQYFGLMALGGIKGAKMGITQMAQRIKQIHPDYVLIFKVGAFYNTFGKDSYIIASTFDYMIKRTKNVPTCGFSKMQFQGDLVYKFERFARNKYDSAIYKIKLKLNGVRVLSARENISTDASGVLMDYPMYFLCYKY